jgi:hypothetical protein
MEVVVIIAENMIAAAYITKHTTTVIFEEKVPNAVYLIENGNDIAHGVLVEAQAAAFRKAMQSPSSKCRQVFIRKDVSREKFFEFLG